MKIESARLREESAGTIWKNLSQQRDEATGVDMNVEATKMMTYEQMFQAMAKYINVIANTMQEIMAITM